MAKYNPRLRLVDFWVGVPVIFLLGILRKRRSKPASPRRVAVVSPTAIGDLILSTGVLLHLRDVYPNAEIHLFHGPPNIGVLPLLPFAVHAHVCDFSKLGATLATIRAAKLDVLVDLAPWPRITALCAALSGAMTVGYASEGQRRHYAYDVPVTHRSDRHEVENLTDVASVFRPCKPYRVRLTDDLPLPKIELPYDRLILFHVTAGGSRADDKSWPIAHWAELSRRLSRDGYMLGFTGISADSERVGSIVSLSGLAPDAVISLCGAMSLAELAGLLKLCRLFVTVDTGVLHLASALGATTVALHGPTRSRRWGARSVAVTSLDSPHEAAGFIHFGFESSPVGGEVMRSLTVDSVYEAAMVRLTARAVDHR
jgi:ADP-heptose:LPS heptosyltransferase